MANFLTKEMDMAGFILSILCLPGTVAMLILETLAIYRRGVSIEPGLISFLRAMSMGVEMFVILAILWIFGFVFSVIGMSKKTKGFAYAGFIISVLPVGLILLIWNAIE
jgi:hypothetical protein